MTTEQLRPESLESKSLKPFQSIVPKSQLASSPTPAESNPPSTSNSTPDTRREPEQEKPSGHHHLARTEGIEPANTHHAYPTESRMRQKEQEKLDKTAGKVKPKRKTDDCEKVWTDCGDDTTSIDLPHVVHFTDTAAERQLMLDEMLLAELTDMSCFFLGGPLPPGKPHDHVEHFASMEVYLAKWSRT